jgi:F420-dependent oxidoreductase-like protein
MPRYAIKTAPQHCRWSDILEIWKAADQMEVFESAWNFDHFYPIVGDLTGPCMEAWTTLSALAQSTSRLRVGCMVTGLHSRHPAIIANMAASVDIISNGRLNLGLGAGWFEPEAVAYGIDLGSVTRRLDRFDEGVEVIARLLSQETTNFDGKFFHLTEARCEPKGPQQPHPPIVIGGQGEKRTLRTVARWAQMWDALRIEPEAWVKKYEILSGYCEELGRDPKEITCSTHLMPSADSDPGAMLDQAARLFEVGLDLAIFSLRPPYSVGMVEKLAEAIAKRA